MTKKITVFLSPSLLRLKLCRIIYHSRPQFWQFIFQESSTIFHSMSIILVGQALVLVGGTTASHEQNDYFYTWWDDL